MAMIYYWTDSDHPADPADETPRAVHRDVQSAMDEAFKQNETYGQFDHPRRVGVHNGSLPHWANAVIEPDGSQRRLLQNEELETAAADEVLVDIRTSLDPSDDERGTLYVDADDTICCRSINGSWTVPMVPPAEISPADLDAEPDSTRPPARG